MMVLTPTDMHEGLRLLGEKWGLGRRLSFGELARCLEMHPRRSGARTYHDLGLEACRRPTGPQRLVVQAMLEGFIPPGAPRCAKA